MRRSVAQTGVPKPRPRTDTVEGFVHGRWLKAIRGEVAEAGWRNYLTVMDAYVLPRIGPMLLTRLTALDVESMYRDLLKSGRKTGGGLSGTTVAQIHRTVRRMLNDAVRWGLIRVNPAAIAADVVAVLRAHAMAQAQERKAMGLGPAALDDTVFADRRGAPYHPQQLRARFASACERAGLPAIRLDLRHTMATAALEAGIHPKIVQERLGHSSVKMTLDVYSHVGTTIQGSAAEQLHRHMNGRSAS